jgi:hypothetical protein
MTGQVYRLFDKEFRGKTLWSFRLEGDPVYYRLNENRNAGIVEPTNYIEFDFEPNSDGKSATVKGTPRKVQPAAAPQQALGSSGTVSYAERDASIRYQSARKDAIEFVAQAIAAGAVVLPAKASAKLEALEALVDSYTASFFEDISTGGAITRTNERAYSEQEEATAPAPAVKKKRAVVVEDDEDSEDDE